MVTIDKIILDVLNNNITKNTLEFINNCNKEVKDICYHYLFDKFPINRFYIHDNTFTEFLNILTSNCKFRVMTKKYKEIKLSNIEKYNDYKLKEKILFDCNLMLATDKEKYILEYPTSKYITQGNKLNKLFFHTGKLNDSIDCYSNKFIKKLLDNIENLNNCYKDIIDDYNNNSSIYKCGLLLNISKDILDIICGEHMFYYYVCILIRFNYKIAFDFDKYIIYLTDRISQFPEIDIILDSHVKDVKDYNKKYLYYNKLFNEHNTFNLFFRLLEIHYFKRDFDAYLEFANNNINILIKFKNYTQYEYIFAILFRLFNYMLKNQDVQNKYPELFNIFDTLFYNSIMVYDSHNNNYKFLLQRMTDEHRKLKDSEDNTICVICLEQLEDSSKIALCIYCNKYIGHRNCVTESYKLYNKCPYCNTS